MADTIAGRPGSRPDASTGQDERGYRRPARAIVRRPTSAACRPPRRRGCVCYRTERQGSDLPGVSFERCDELTARGVPETHGLIRVAPPIARVAA